MTTVDRTGAPEFERSWDEPRTEAELYHLGFARIGAVGLADGENVDTTGVYEEPDRLWLLRHAPLLTPLYYAPASCTFASVSRFHGNSLAIRMRTRLSNGHLVHTALEWGRLPNLVGLAALLADSNAIEAQTRAHAPRAGIHVRIVRAEGAEPLLEAHRAHLDAVTSLTGATPVGPGTPSEYVRITNWVNAYEFEVKQRESNLGILLYGLIPFTLICLGLISLGYGGLTGVGLLSIAFTLAALGWVLRGARPSILIARRITRAVWLPRVPDFPKG